MALETEPIFLLNRFCSSVYCQQNILCLPIFGSDIVDVVGDDEGYTEFLAHRDEGFVDFFLLWDAVILQFKEEVIGSKNFPKLASQFFRCCDVIPQNRAANRACKTGTCSNQAFMVFCQ